MQFSVGYFAALVWSNSTVKRIREELLANKFHRFAQRSIRGLDESI
jgi:hypothetical protein